MDQLPTDFYELELGIGGADGDTERNAEQLSIDIDMKDLAVQILKSGIEPNQDLIMRTRTNSEILSRIHTDLFSENVTKRKLSLYVLRLLASTEAEDPNSVMALFFDTFETLDEKQYIIEPFLLKLEARSVEFQTEEFLQRAYLTLLQKMIQHENRKIVEKGLSAFITSRSTRQFGTEGNKVANLVTRTLYLNFLVSTVMPKIRDGIGWIFSEAEEFFGAAKKFGTFLIIMQEDVQPRSIFQFTFKFLIESQDKGLSPFSALFLLKALHVYSSSQLPNLPSLNNEDLGLLNSFLGRISSIASIYGQSLIETEVITLFALLYPAGTCNLAKDQVEENLKSTGIRQFFAQLSRTGILSHWPKFGNLNISSSHLLETLPSTASEEDVIAAGRFLFICNNMDHLPKDRLDLLEGTPGMLEYLKFIAFLSSAGLVYTEADKNILSDVVTRTLSAVNNCPAEHSHSSYNYRVLEIFLDAYASRFDFNSIALDETYRVLDQEVTNNLNLGQRMADDLLLISRLLILSKVLVKVGHQSSPVCTPAVFQKLVDATNYEGGNDRTLISQFYEARINILSHILQVLSTSGDTELNINTPVLSILSSMDILPPRGIIASINFITCALSFPQLRPESHEMAEFVPYCWAQVLEMKRSDVFWQCVTSFVDLIAHEYFQGSGILSEYSSKIFEKGENIVGLPLILLEKLSKLVLGFATMAETEKREARVAEITEICLRASYFGAHLMKQTRLISRIYDYECRQEPPEISAEEEGSSVRKNSWDKPEFILTADCRTRIIGLVTLLDLQKLNPASLGSIVKHFLDANDKESDRQSRYYGNSSVHRTKHRIAQALLLLQPRYTPDIASEVTLRLMASLTRDSPQLSVRYLMEWTIALNLIKYPEVNVQNEFFDASVKNMQQRAGFGCNFSTISYQTSQGILNSNSLDYLFIRRALDMLVNLLIGQHLPVRVYASVCFLRIYAKWIEKLEVREIEQYEIIYKNLAKGSLATSGTFLKTVKAVEDFWVDYFHPVKDLNLEAVLIDIPLLSGMSFDESIQRKDFLRLKYNYLFHEADIRLHHEQKRWEGYGDLLSKFGLKEQTKLAFEEGAREMGEEAPEIRQATATTTTDDLGTLPTEVTLIQKKVNPWKFLPVAEEELAQFSEIIQERKKTCAEEGLVVVASLIDRIPNLGGLCRSSEIFGVSKLVVPSLKILNDQQFKALSVSSHNWVEIMEVLPRELEDFLRSYAAKGYTILAIEQAVGSIPLNQFKFPRKSVLLLGHEKTGIPAELLHVVDKCLEIPQLGVVRSLNVHVTGAIAIWQYASQHLIPNSQISE